MKHGLPERVINDITSLARTYGVHKVILFGSRARGTHTERSDIDIAVSGGSFDVFCLNIKEKVHSLLTFDIIDLDSGISEELKKEIERDGIIIYEET